MHRRLEHPGGEVRKIDGDVDADHKTDKRQQRVVPGQRPARGPGLCREMQERERQRGRKRGRKKLSVCELLCLAAY